MKGRYDLDLKGADIPQVGKEHEESLGWEPEVPSANDVITFGVSPCVAETRLSPIKRNFEYPSRMLLNCVL